MIKIPKGTRDYDGEDYHKLEYLKDVIQNIFIKYDGKPLETPVFELTDVLTDKYGEEEKLIYNLEKHDTKDPKDENCIINMIPKDMIDTKDMKGETLSLRYDHTIPFVRYCITNKIDKMKRYCIGKVYRRETTTWEQIRQREFYQADFDFIGQYDDFLPELQIFCMIQELFQILNVTNYQIIYNYRQNLDYYVREAGINSDKLQTVCSSIDKLDKHDKQTVREELMTKGIEEAQINKLYEFLFSDKIIMEPEVLQMDQQFVKYMEQIKILDMTKIRYTPTLARGLDYYTGIIFEVKLTNSNLTSSLCAGGRYDKLMNTYRKDDNIVPMIGFCFGIDRLLPLVTTYEQTHPTKIWITVIGKIIDSSEIKLGIAGRLLRKGFSVLYNLSYHAPGKEFKQASEKKCDYTIIIGQTEIENKTFSIKNMNTCEQTKIAMDQFDTYFDQLDLII